MNQLCNIDHLTKEYQLKNDTFNPESPIWLGWLHAVSLINNISIDGVIAERTSAESIAKLLEPAYIQATKLAEQYSFNWTYEHTTR